MAEDILDQVFEECGIQLQRIIDAYKRGPAPTPSHPETIVEYADGSISSFNIEDALGENSIPDKYNAVKVDIGTAATSIGDFAFANCSSLTSVTIPDSVTSIGDFAFRGCSGLTSITIPDSVTSIGNQAFYYCSALTSITIGNGVTSIGSQAFAISEHLSTIIFQKTKTEVQAMNPNSWFLAQPSVTIICIDGEIIITPSCFLKGTKILLADGSSKNVEDLTYSDSLKVWDFDNGCLGIANICWLTKPNLKNDHYYKLTFDNGTVLKTTGINSNHRIYSVDQNKFVNVSDSKIGDKVYSIDGVLTIENVEYIEEMCEYWNVITSQKYNCFAERILTSDRYGNIYSIDSSMKYIKDDRIIRPYSDYEAVGISRYWYDNLRLGEVNETIEKTKEYIAKCEGQMLPLSK